MSSVLIIDDSKTFLRILENSVKDKLKVLGFAQNGLDGFEMYKELKPDLVLLDITMPNCSGKECLQKIMEFNPSAKVIMVSSLGDETTVKDCMVLGARAFVKKEFITASGLTGSNVLIQTIMNVMEVPVLEAA